jgi:predicted FMN-binding regulatory protein PaiB
MGQNRPLEDRNGVADELEEQGKPEVEKRISP